MLALQVLIVVLLHATATQPGLIGAPAAILVDAASYLVSGVLLATLRTSEPGSVRGHLLGELREGVRFVYRHPMLAPYALTSHAWFVGNTMLSTAMVPFILRNFGITPLGLGLAYAVGGVGGVLGSQLSASAETWLGVGRAVILDRFACPLSFPFVSLGPAGGAWPLIACGQFVFWFSISTGGPIELGYRQSVTPDRLQGRVNATIRSMNWGLTALGAPPRGLPAQIGKASGR